MLKNEPKKFIDFNNFLSSCLNTACAGSYDKVVDIILQYKNVTSYYTLQYACEGGNKTIIDKILQFRKKDPKFKSTEIEEWVCGAYGACAGGKLDIFMDIVKLHTSTNSCIFWGNCLEHVTNKPKADLKVANFIMDSYMYNNNKMYCLYKIFNNIFGKNTINPRFVATNDLLLYACRMGHIRYINLIINSTTVQDTTKWNRGLVGACFGGRLNIVKLMITQGATDWNNGLIGACERGRFEIAELMIEKGAICWYDALSCACIGNYLETARLIIHKCTDLERIYLNINLWLACIHSSVKIIKLLVTSGASDWNKGLRSACSHGRADVAMLMIEYGATNLNECMNNSYDVVILQLLVSAGANDLSRLKDTTDFKLYCRYCTLYHMYKSSNKFSSNHKYTQLLQKYPPYILFVMSRVNENCSVSRLPSELFRVLILY